MRHLGLGVTLDAQMNMILKSDIEHIKNTLKSLLKRVKDLKIKEKENQKTLLELKNRLADANKDVYEIAPIEDSEQEKE